MMDWNGVTPEFSVSLQVAITDMDAAAKAGFRSGHLQPS